MGVELNPAVSAATDSSLPSPPTAPPRGLSSGTGAPGAASAASAPSPDAVNAAVEQANKLLEAWNRSLRFRVDRTTNQVVVSVINQDTGEVIRQIPPEEQLALQDYLSELTGTIFNRKV